MFDFLTNVTEVYLLYFSVPQKFADFVNFTFLSDRGKVEMDYEKSFHLSGF